MQIDLLKERYTRYIPPCPSCPPKLRSMLPKNVLHPEMLKMLTITCCTCSCVSHVLSFRLSNIILVSIISRTPYAPSSQLSERLSHGLSLSLDKLLAETIPLHCLPVETLSDRSQSSLREGGEDMWELTSRQVVRNSGV